MSETKPSMGLPEAYNGWKDIMTPTDENIYEFVTHSYEGSGGYVDGGYLDKFAKESSLDKRRKLVYYKNYIKGIVDSLIVPVFSDEAVRVTNNDLFEAFLSNVDNKGHGIQEFSKTVIRYARIHGVCFTVMDNFKAEDIPDTTNEAINGRKFPYIYYKTADEVVDYKTNQFNTLEAITFKDGDIIGDDGKPIPTYRLWTETYSVRFIKTDSGIKEIEDKVEHDLGFLPVIATYADLETDVMPHPPVYDLCRMNYTIYNMDSEQRNLERLCAFPTLTIQTKEHDINMDIGADSLITYGSEYDGNVSAPSWINPSEGILQVMNELSNEVVQKLVEASNVLGATAINTGNQAKSGVALQMEFLGQQFALKHTARLSEGYESMVAVMFGLYINETVEYSVTYRDNYQPTQEEIDKKLAIMERLLDLDISEAVSVEVKKELIKDIAKYYKWEADVDALQVSVSDNDLI